MSVSSFVLFQAVIALVKFYLKVGNSAPCLFATCCGSASVYKTTSKRYIVTSSCCNTQVKQVHLWLIAALQNPLNPRRVHRCMRLILLPVSCFHFVPL